MTITGALNNAMSGLRAAGYASQVVSSNLSNALTPGYARRSLELSSSALGGNGGVRVDGQIRHVDPGLLADRQMASASFGNNRDTTAFLSELERLLGTPDQAGSLAGRIAGFESSLITAASRPDAPDRLSSAVNAARDLADTISNAASGIQEQRTRADRSINAQVTRLNDALEELQALNGQITATRVQGGDDAALQDHRQRLVDEVSEMVPVRTVPRANGAIALYTNGGASLLDGKAAEIGFEPVNLVVSGLSIESGSLSGLTVNGNSVRTSSDRGALSGGTLAAQFEIRDELAPEAEVNLDTVARDLIERFQDSGVDPTLAAGAAGLFTDAGAVFDAANEAGISSRLSLNDLVDPDQGGDASRIRDGLGSVVPGNVGDARLLQALGDALTVSRVPASGSFGSGAFNASGLTTSMMSQIAVDRTNSEQHLSFASSMLNELTNQELAQGVDSDAELQRLILIEQAYAANARMIQTVDEMMQTLLRI
jgi:flagellar hook-associated protein 1 FlgK